MNKAIHNQYSCAVIELDKLPEGILLLSNVSQHEWTMALEAYHASDKPDKRMVLFGVDPSIETKALYIEFPRGQTITRSTSGEKWVCENDDKNGDLQNKNAFGADECVVVTGSILEKALCIKLSGGCTCQK